MELQPMEDDDGERRDVELIELLKHDGDIRRTLLEALSADIPSSIATVMNRAYEIYPLRLRQ